MRKSFNYTNSDTTKTSLNKNIEVDKIKTTNVNILLNRVKLDQKKLFKKRIIICSLIILLVSLIGSLAII